MGSARKELTTGEQPGVAATRRSPRQGRDTKPHRGDWRAPGHREHRSALRLSSTDPAWLLEPSNTARLRRAQAWPQAMPLAG